MKPFSDQTFAWTQKMIIIIPTAVVYVEPTFVEF